VGEAQAKPTEKSEKKVCAPTGRRKRSKRRERKKKEKGERKIHALLKTLPR